MKHPQEDELVWRMQILALMNRDLDNKRPYNANFSGECDICNEKIKSGEVFYFAGDKERMCSKCKLRIQGYFEGIIDNFSRTCNTARLTTKFIFPN
jgi:hypothetical protein